MDLLKEITDTKRIEYWIEKEGLLNCFDTPDLVFQAYSYEKGDIIAGPDRKLDKIMFLIEGSVRIYGIRSDGSFLPVNHYTDSAIIGDVEFVRPEASSFFAEAKTASVFLTLSTTRYRRQLDCDLRFLHMLLHAFIYKINLYSTYDTVASTIEERVLLHMKENYPSYELDGIEAAVLQLRCSRRQLQRVLKKLCDAGKIKKTGRGRYKLSE